MDWLAEMGRLLDKARSEGVDLEAVLAETLNRN